MQVSVDIGFDELLKIVKNLPESKLSKLKEELEKTNQQVSNRSDFEAFLLKGPTFSKEQFKNITQTRKAINKWRTK